MRGFRRLELITTKYFVGAIGGVALVVLGAVWLMVDRQLASLDAIAKGADITLKMVAAIVGPAWVLNRYFTSRTDEPQVRVEATLDVVEGTEFDPPAGVDLLLYRLDIINTGKTLIGTFEQQLVIEAVTPGQQGPEYSELYRWPSRGMHKAGAIEPGSWSAVSDSLLVRPEVMAVRIYIELVLDTGVRSTWHRTYRVNRRRGVAPRSWHVASLELPAGPVSGARAPNFVGPQICRQCGTDVNDESPTGGIGPGAVTAQWRAPRERVSTHSKPEDT